MPPPPDNCPPSRTIASWMIVPGQLPPRKVAPRTIAPKIIASWIIAQWMIAPGFLLPNSYLKDNAPDNIPWKLPPGKTAFWIICHLHNCPSDKLSRGKLPPRKMILKINYAEIFSPRTGGFFNRTLFPLVFLLCGLN